MAIRRQATKTGLASGNFGTAGTPLPSVSQAGGPDYGRLVKSLGVAVGSAVESRQKENVESASAAIRQVILDTKQRPAGVSKEDHKKFQMNSLAAVRAQFEDQGVFLEAFAKENPAVQVMDKISGRARALETKNAMAQALENNKDKPLEEQQELLFKILEQDGAMTEGISEGTNNAFLESITESAIAFDDRLLANHAERTKQLGVATLSDAYFKLGNDKLSAIAGVDSATMNTDINKFQEGRQAIQNNLVSTKIDIANKAKEMYSDIRTTSGDSVVAGNKAVDFVVQMATQYNTPELLDTLEEVKAGNRQPLAALHREQIQQARTQIQGGIVRREQALRAKRESEISAHTKQEYAGYAQQANEAISTAQMNLGDPVAVGMARDTMNTLMTKFNKDKNSGKYSDNPEQALRINKTLISNQLALNSTFGDAAAEAIVTEAITNGSFNQAMFNRYADRLGPHMKREAYNVILPEIEQAANERSTLRQAEQQTRIYNLAKPALDFAQKNLAFEGSELSQATIKTIEAGDLTSLNFPKVDMKAFKAEYKKAQNDFTTKNINEKKGVPTVEELNEAGQPIIDKYQSIYDARKVEIEKRNATVRTKMAEDAQKRIEDAVKARPELRKLTESSIFSATTMEPEEIKSAYKAFADGDTAVLGPQAQQQMFSNLLVTDIRAKKMNIAKSISLVKKHTPTLDVKKRVDREFLADIISDGIDQGVDAERYAPNPNLKVPGTDPSGPQNFIDSVLGRGFEVVGLRDSFKDEIDAGIRTGDIFTKAGLTRLKRKFPNKSTWGDIEKALQIEE
jgi:hypothetical protein